MRSDISHLEQFRHTKATHPMATQEGDRHGVFYIPHGTSSFIFIFDDGTSMEGGVDGTAWEHLSFRAVDGQGKNRTPSWEECCWAKQLFWEPEECVVQFHPPRSEYVNNHKNVLHLWKKLGEDFPRPAPILVGVKELGTIAGS